MEIAHPAIPIDDGASSAKVNKAAARDRNLLAVPITATVVVEKFSLTVIVR